MIVEFTYRFEAAHRFLKTSSKSCMTPHGHTWYATLCLQFMASQLDDSQMTVEFSAMKKDWKALIQNVFDHSYMHNSMDPVVDVLKANGGAPRLIPFPGDPTTEMIALLLFRKMDSLLSQSPHSSRMSITAIRLQETPTNTVLCDRASFEVQIPQFLKHNAWWNSVDIENRSFDVL